MFSLRVIKLRTVNRFAWWISRWVLFIEALIGIFSFGYLTTDLEKIWVRYVEAKIRRKEGRYQFMGDWFRKK